MQEQPEPQAKAISVAQARQIDKDAVERLGMPSILLMENASRAVAEAAAELGDTFCIYCGPGNNGGDGLAAARHLGRRARVYLMAEPSAERSPDAALQLEILHRAGYEFSVGELPPLLAEPGPGTVLIDAMFGTGLDRPLEGKAVEWVQRFNDCSGRKLCVDIPSGLHGDTGEVLGIACRAEVTITFEAAKLGLVTEGAKEYVGELRVGKLGLP